MSEVVPHVCVWIYTYVVPTELCKNDYYDKISVMKWEKKIVIENSHLGIINVRNIHHHYIYAKQFLKVLLDTYTLIY